jgi:hypothetical protein
MTGEKVALIVKFFDIFLFCLFFYLFNILMFVITNSPVSGVSYIICICPGMHIFRHIFVSNYWWQRSAIWSQASYRYPISWEWFYDPSDSYFLFAEERGYHKWALAHSSSCFLFCLFFYLFNILMFVITNSPVSGVSYIICICPGGMWNIKTVGLVFNATSNNISC